MKRVILGLCLVLVGFEAQAISRYATPAMTCAQIQAAVQNDGAAILQWRSTRNPSLPLYGRYVRNGGFCQYAEYATTGYVPARDRKSCPVNKCETIEPPTER